MQVQICDICGDAGYDDELAICGGCNDAAEHIYCMAAMLDSVPLQWVCERCELEEKGSIKKKLACSEPFPIEGVEKHTTANPFSFSELNEAKNVVTMPKSLSQSGSKILPRQDNQPDLSSSNSPGLTRLSEVQTQIHNREKSNLFPMHAIPVGKTCCSTPKLEGAAVQTVGLSASLSSTACKVSSKGNPNVTYPSKSLADRPLSRTKHVFSRSSSFPVGDDKLTFLLPSRPKDLKRSKSTVVRLTTTWTDNSNIKSSNRDENSTLAKKDVYTKGLTHATHGCAMHGASHKMESIKSTSAVGPKVHGEFKKQQYDWSSRDSDALQSHGRSGKEIVFQHSKGPRRCFKCDQGHADCVQGSATVQQAQGVDARNYEQLQGGSNPVSPPGNGVGSGALPLRETGLAVDSFSQAQLESLAEPCVQILWSGCFSISSTCLTAYNGMQAHASTKADPRISEAMKSLPFELRLEELKRGVETGTWPRSLQNRPPTSSSIGVYFFPVDMECHDTWYKPLLDRLVANDLALRTSMDFFQLLIFPSHLLPEADRCWDDRQYLWGILQNANVKSSCTITFGETV
ncbi:hypothetical protein GOP47_0010168 [Adiantum capillus-veneris]|uniref:AIPP2-like SPOC-like domain-containing protein n=1 Tax=Adiantum capillus-veneris TaxID=13818 RepID=A0A9D4UUN1_ADICA|nr:hypothetical protein GOP47_0010168 [Adiantum capillus-veneris]